MLEDAAPLAGGFGAEEGARLGVARFGEIALDRGAHRIDGLAHSLCFGLSRAPPLLDDRVGARRRFRHALARQLPRLVDAQPRHGSDCLQDGFATDPVHRHPGSRALGGQPQAKAG